MGIYRAVVSNPTLIRLEHLDPQDQHTLEFHGNVPAWLLAVIEEGAHIVASFGFTKMVEGPTTSGPPEAPDPGSPNPQVGLPSFPEPAPNPNETPVAGPVTTVETPGINVSAEANTPL